MTPAAMAGDELGVLGGIINTDREPPPLYPAQDLPEPWLLTAGDRYIAMKQRHMLQRAAASPFMLQQQDAAFAKVRIG